MPQVLSYELHKLVALLDRGADGLLRRGEGVSYSRFLALFAVRHTGGSQRELARWLGLAEPSASRMVEVLERKGLLRSIKVAGAGNRRQLQLTQEGSALTERCSRLLEGRFVELLKVSGVPYAAYQRHTRRLLQQLEKYQTQSVRGEGVA
jgi:DNA-binding MarR family transcriptional regulator